MVEPVRTSPTPSTDTNITAGRSSVSKSRLVHQGHREQLGRRATTVSILFLVRRNNVLRGELPPPPRWHYRSNSFRIPLPLSSHPVPPFPDLL